MSNLMYSRNDDNLVTRRDLSLTLNLPLSFFLRQPYPFDEYVNEVEHSLNLNGLQVNSEEYAVTKDNGRMFGLMKVGAIEGELITAKDWEIMVALRGGHDERISRGIALGNRVMICSNLCFNGDLGTFSTKQTLNIAQRLPALINNAVSMIPELAYKQEQKFNHYKDYDLKPRIGDAALVEIARRGGFTAAQLMRAISQWDKPDYEEHADQGFSLWRLFNASTEALKPTGDNVNMITVEQRSKVVSSFIDEVAGI